ncbi:hypothetical protein BDR04DRAFT_1164992 [Suillus decipiens]|nr:hypothetical protein BDR04DRAFT_1164992 [Suillus decipiens]
MPSLPSPVTRPWDKKTLNEARIGVASSDHGFGNVLTVAQYHYRSIYDSQMWYEVYTDPSFRMLRAALLLSKNLPFGKRSNAWDTTSDKFDVWDNFPQHAVNKALDCGTDASVLDRAA